MIAGVLLGLCIGIALGVWARSASARADRDEFDAAVARLTGENQAAAEASPEIALGERAWLLDAVWEVDARMAEDEYAEHLRVRVRSRMTGDVSLVLIGCGEAEAARVVMAALPDGTSAGLRADFPDLLPDGPEWEA